MKSKKLSIPEERFPACCQFFNGKILVLRDDHGEGNTSLTFQNPQRQTLSVVLVDGCAIKDGIRCDYLVIDQHRDEYYIEFKGKRTAEACRQILATVKLLQTSARNKYGIIIATRSKKPKIDTRLQQERANFEKAHIELVIKSKHETITLK